MRTLLLLAAIFSFYSFSSCDSRPDKEGNWEITLDFPEQALDPGSNTLQLDLPETSKSFAEKNGMDAKAIQSVELTSAELLLEDGNNMDDVESAIFQLSTKEAPMKQIALGEMKEKGKSNLPLTLAKDVNATDYFSSDKVIAVVEVNAIDGGEKTYKFKMKVKFKFISKQK